jgi:hypothetical protein
MRLPWWAPSLLSLLLLTVVAFSRYPHSLFFQFDGTLILGMQRLQTQWMIPGIDFDLNFFEGLGDIWLPINTSIIPGFVLGGLMHDSRAMPVVACVVFALEYFASSLILARCFHAGSAAALAGAWLGATLALPLAVPWIINYRLWGSPDLLTIVAVNSLALCAFQQIGRYGRAADIAAAVSFIVLLGYIAISQTVPGVMAFPMTAFFAFATIIGAGDRRERRRKMIAGIVVVVIGSIGLGPYLVALFYYAKTTFFWGDLVSFPITWNQQSFLMTSGEAGMAPWIAGIAGAALASIRENGKFRQLALALLLFVALQQIPLLVFTAVGLDWAGPPFAYIDMFAVPLYSLFGGYLVIGVWTHRPEVQRWAPIVLAVIPWGTLLLMHNYFGVGAERYRQSHAFLWPPSETSITRQLQAAIALKEGEPFRGRVANIAKGDEGRPEFVQVPFVTQHSYDAALSIFTGNDHRYYGMWYYNIPTLFETNQFASPFFDLLSSRLLKDPQDKDVRAHATITRFDKRLYELLGIRFVISDHLLPDMEPIERLVAMPDRPEWTLFLYEVPEAAVAGYWSTRPLSAAKVRVGLQWLSGEAADDFDAVVYESVPADLVTGTASVLRAFRGYLEIEAFSPGASLLVLPLEYSHCFEIGARAGGDVRLVRANVNQAALLFSGKVRVELRYRYSIFHFICRFADIQDARRLDLVGAGHWNAGRKEPRGMP